MKNVLILEFEQYDKILSDLELARLELEQNPKTKDFANIFKVALDKNNPINFLIIQLKGIEKMNIDNYIKKIVIDTIRKIVD